ncbi:outer membrane protein [Helicobacter salomonis]|uniref:outer membrane protein n=1 Tax=Helicobacter salomonis TaxID=56878 RepID=UPI000CF17FBC|nr:outer membrane protein [Helicobacter salomonis]
MKHFSSYKRSLSVALCACFNFVPSLDAADMDAYQVVNSISGLLGGSYQLGIGDSGGLTYNGPTQQDWTLSNTTNAQAVPASIFSVGGSVALKGSGPSLVNGTYVPSGTANVAGYGTGAADNPYPTNFNLYGYKGLLNDYNYSSSSGQFYNIYNFPSLGGLLTTAYNKAAIGYVNRTNFSGIDTPANNILGNTNNPSPANPYFSITTVGGATTAVGNLTSSQTTNTTTANSYLTSLYKNITTIYDNLKIAAPSVASGPFSSSMVGPYDATYDTVFSGVQTAGTALLAALNNTATSGFTNASLVNLNSVLSTPLISGSAGSYTFSGTGLQQLYALENINNLIQGGIATSTGLTQNFKNVMTVLSDSTTIGGSTALSNLQTIANNTLNTANGTTLPGTGTAAINAVVAAIDSLNASLSPGQVANLTQVAGALQGLVNPGAYQAVYAAYEALSGKGAYSVNPLNGNGTFASNGSTTNYLANLKSAFGSTGGVAIANALMVNAEQNAANEGALVSGLSTLFSNPGSVTAFAALASALGSSGSFAQLQTILKDAGLSASANTLSSANPSTNYSKVAASQFTSDNIKTGGSGVSGSGGTLSPTSAYPVSKPPSTVGTNQSWVITQAANQNSYDKALGTSVANVLSGALNYSSNASALSGLLKSGTSLTDILNAGINNAVSAGTLSSNANATALNDIRAIFYSHGLLSDYVGAITAPQSSVAAQQAQASALVLLNGALNASATQNGLIAQTRNAIESNLNANFNLTGLSSAQAEAALSGVSSATFKANATTAQIAAGIGGLNDLSQVAGYNSSTGWGAGTDTSGFNFNLTTLSTLSANAYALVGKTLTFETAFPAGLSSAQEMALKAELNWSSDGSFLITESNVAALISAAQTLGAASIDLDQLFTGASIGAGNKANWYAPVTTAVASAPSGTATNIEDILANFIKSSSSAGSIFQAAGMLVNNPTTGISTVTQTTNAFAKVIAIANSVAEGASEGLGNVAANIGNPSKSIAVNAINALLTPEGLNAVAITNSSNALVAPTAGTQIAKILADAPQLVNDLGLLGPSMAKQFANGTLSASGLSDALNKIRGDYATVGSYGIENDGSVGLGVGLSSLLSSSVSAPQNLGFANAAVYTIVSKLQSLAPMLSQTYAQTFLMPSGQSSNAINALTALNKAVGDLYAANSSFFSNAVVSSNVAFTHNGYNWTGTSSLGNSGLNPNYPLAGIPSIGVNSNTSAYLGNLQNLWTLTNYLGPVVSTGATSTAYKDALTLNGTNSGSVAAGLYDNGMTLVNALKPGVQLSALVGALEGFTSASASLNNYAAVKSAIADLTNGTANAQAIWTAYNTIANTDFSTTNATYVQTLYNILKGVNASNVPSSLTNSAGTAPDPVAVAQVIKTGIALQKANTALAGTTGTISQNNSGTLSINAGNSAAFSAATAAAQAYGTLIGYLNSANQDNTDSVAKLIKVINDYEHNLGLLNNLTDGKGGSIASQAVAYASASKNFNNLSTTSKSLSLANTPSNLNNLQTLVNRLQYLESLQTQIQNAIDANPYAMVLQKNYLVSSTGYQSALQPFVSGNNKIFNTGTIKTIGTMSGTTFTTNAAFSGVLDRVSTDLGNIGAWNQMLNGVNGSSGALIPGISYSTNIATNMGTIASSVNNILSGYSLGSDGSAGALSVVQGVLGAYSNSTGTGIDQLLTNYNNTNEAAGGLASGSFVSSTVLTPSNLTTPAFGGTAYSAFQALEGVVNLNNQIVGGLSTGTAATGDYKFFFGTGGTVTVTGGRTAVNNIAQDLGNTIGKLTNAGATSYAYNATTGSTSVGTTTYDFSGITGSAAQVTLSGAAAASAAPASSNSNIAVYLEAMAQALATNPNTKDIWADPSTITATTDAGKVGTALAGIVDTANKGVIDGWTAGSDLSNFVTSLKNLVGNGSSNVFTTALSILNNRSSITAPTSIQATGVTNNLNAVLASMGSLLNSYNAANAVMGNAGTAGLSSWINTTAGSNGNTYIQQIQALVKSVQEVYTPVSATVSDTGALTTVSTAQNGNTAGALSTAEQALYTYVTANPGASFASLASPKLSTFMTSGSTGAADFSAIGTSVGSATAKVPAGLVATVAAQIVQNALNAGTVTYDGSGTYGGNINGNVISNNTTASKVLEYSTPAQIQAAVQAVATNFKANVLDNWSSLTNAGSAIANAINHGTSLVAGQNIATDSPLTYALTQAGSYTEAIKALQPLLAAGNNSTSASAILKAAVDNATALQSLFNYLNGGGKITGVNGSNGVAINTLSKSGLSPAVVARLKTLIANMQGEQKVLGKLESAIASNPTANALNNITAGASGMQQFDNAASKVQSGAMSTTQYISDSQSNMEAIGGLLVANGYNVKSLATSAQTSLQTVSSLANFAGLDSAMKALISTLNSPSLTYQMGLDALDAVMSQLQSVQATLLSMLAPGGGSPDTIVLPNGRKVGAIVLGDRRGFGDSPPTPAQIITALKAIQNAMARVYAATKVYKTNGKSFIVLGEQTPIGRVIGPMQYRNNNGNMYGVNVQFGYKQFFGKRKRWGLRYYGSFSYQHGTFMNGAASELDNFVYGAGVDALYNFYESKDAKYTSGIFAGFMLAGSSWNVKGASAWISRMNSIKASGGSAQMNTTYFQIPLNIGFRTNVSKHSGFEIGLRIPLAVNYYFKGDLDGARETIAYKRNVSVFFNYVYNF